MSIPDLYNVYEKDVTWFLDHQLPGFLAPIPNLITITISSLADSRVWRRAYSLAMK